MGEWHTSSSDTKEELNAKAILEHCSVGFASEYSKHIRKLTESIKNAPEELKKYLYDITDDFSEETYKALTKPSEIGEAPHGAIPHFDYSKRTEFDTSYGDIAMWVTSFIAQDYVKAFDYTDDHYYDVICRGVEEADETLRYYLSNAVDNFLSKNEKSLDNEPKDERD